MLGEEKGRLDKASPVVRKDLQRHINFLEQSIATLNQEFNRTVQSSVAWR
jgi:hypothetical protein